MSSRGTKGGIAAAAKLDGIDSEGLRASAALAGVVARVSLSGNADTRSMQAIDELLKRVHARCMDAKVVEVTVDLRALDFMNSSCFKAFVTWLSTMRETERAKQYKIIFVSDPKKHWQHRSLHALACFAVELVTIQA